VDQNYVTCALCGHRFSERFVRERGSVTCVCGLRIDSEALPSRSHHLRNAVCLLVAAVLIAAAASIGRHFVG
jgi:hypothetical protein